MNLIKPHETYEHDNDILDSRLDNRVLKLPLGWFPGSLCDHGINHINTIRERRVG